MDTIPLQVCAVRKNIYESAKVPEKSYVDCPGRYDRRILNKMLGILVER